MNKKKIIIITIIILIIALIIYCLSKKPKENNKEIFLNEYTPQEEITEEELRKTIVTLYFLNKETNTLMPETRLIDVKKLSKDPYNEIIKLLIEGPKSEKLSKVIPEGTKINEVKIIGKTVYLDLSKEFIENHDDGAEKETNTINSIVNTLVELNEVSSVKILIDGEENREFKDGKINFKNEFVKINQENTKKINGE